MATRRAHLIKSIMAGVIWLLLRVPTDLVLIRDSPRDIVMFAITVQILDVLVVAYLIYQVLRYRIHKPWKCPVCDGWGKRMYTPGISAQVKAQLATCESCHGSGVVWEVVSSGEGDSVL